VPLPDRESLILTVGVLGVVSEAAWHALLLFVLHFVHFGVEHHFMPSFGHPMLFLT